MNRTSILSCILVLAILSSAVLLITPGTSRGSTVIIVDIATDETWTAAGGPYLIMTSIHVISPNTLTIEPGTNVRFDNGITLTVDTGATLIAIGNGSAGRVVFNATNPQNTWGGIILQSMGNQFIECNFSQGSPAVNIVSNNNMIMNCTFTDSPTGVQMGGKNNLVRNCVFRNGLDTAVAMSFGNFNSIENCDISGAATGIEIKTASNNNFVNSTIIAGGDTALAIDGSSNIKVNDSAFLNNEYCILVTGTALSNQIRGSTLLASTEYVIKTSNPFDASGNYWGLTEEGNIASLVSGSVDHTNPLSSEPTGLTLQTIDSATTWTTPQSVVGGLLVSSDLTVTTSKITFNDPNGYNFIYVTGSLTLQGASVDSNQESSLIFFAPGSTGTFSDSTVADGFTILAYTPNIVFQTSTFINGTNAVVLKNAPGAEISNCTFTNNTLALKATSSQGLVLKDNVLNDNVNLNGAHDSVIMSNSFDTGSLALAGSNKCSIASNNFSNINGRSLQFSSSSENLVLENMFYKNTEGIRINPGCSLNMIILNQFQYNSLTPIYITATDGNFIYHNNFLGSFLYTSVDDGSNYWNNSLKEGNFWSEYIGQDDGSTSRPKGDGVGDTFIPHMLVDNNPFVNPFGWLYPKTPGLDSLGSAADTDGEYNVTWSHSGNSMWYVVHESTSPSFAVYEEIYNGSNAQFTITDQEKARYYYRVKGVNSRGSSSWSNTVNIYVNMVPEALTDPAVVAFGEDGSSGFVFNLSTIFTDPDGDVLEFSFDEPVNITIEINETGYVNASAAKANWFGLEEVMFYATDGMFTVNRTIIFGLNAVNDPPGEPVITLTPTFKSLAHWELTNLSAACTDIDTDQDNLTFTWSSNISGVLGTGTEVLNLDLTGGVHEITLNVTDGEFYKEAVVVINKEKDPIPVDPVPDDDDDDDNTATTVAVIAVLGILVFIVIGVMVYFVMRKKSIEAAEELSKEQADHEKEAKIKKIKKVAAKDRAAEDGELAEGDDIGPEMMAIGEEDGDGIPDIGPTMGPIMEEDAGEGGEISPEEKQKMLDELDELLFADEITEEEYITKVNEIEGM